MLSNGNTKSLYITFLFDWGGGGKWFTTYLKCFCMFCSPVRLLNGSLSTEGLVQARVGKSWHLACADDWSGEISDSVCQLLGLGWVINIHCALWLVCRFVECILAFPSSFHWCTLQKNDKCICLCQVECSVCQQIWECGKPCLDDIQHRIDDSKHGRLGMRMHIGEHWESVVDASPFYHFLSSFTSSLS